MGCFSAVGRHTAHGRRIASLPGRVALELIAAMCLASLYFSYLRPPVSARVTASDASERGGGLGALSVVSSSGATRALALDSAPAMRGETDLMLVTLDDDVWGVRAAVVLLGFTCNVQAAFVCGDGRRITATRWLDCLIYDSQDKVDRSVASTWRDQLRVGRLGLVACQLGRRDLGCCETASAALSLCSSDYKFLTSLVKGIQWELRLETEADLPDKVQTLITTRLPVHGHLWGAANFSWLRKPRIFWTSWCAAGLGTEDVTIGSRISQVVSVGD